jgi:CP family cyanate transporter-like MFS transporter
MPVLCFGIGAFASPWLSRRFGLTHTFTMVLVLLTLGIALRPWFGYTILLVCSLLVTLGIAVSNVLFPALIRAEFPNNVARMTALYTTLLAIFASGAATFAVPLSDALGGWQGSIFFWAIPGILAIGAWLMTSRQQALAQPAVTALATGDRHVWLHPITWSLVGFFGLQSMNFYCILNWLPAILEFKGFTQAEAGGLLGLVTVVGVPFGMIITANLKRFKSISLLALVISLVTTFGLLLLLGTGPLVVIGGVITGLGLACSFPLSMALIALKAHNEVQTTLLSTIAQGVGYLIAAIGTFVLGLSFGVTGAWTWGIGFLAVSAMVQSFIGLYAGSKRTL